MICGFEYWGDCVCAGKVYGEEEAEAEGGGAGDGVDTRIVDDEDDADIPGGFIAGAG